MGMAPYGKPLYADKIYDKLLKVADDGSFRTDMDYFSYHYSDEKMFNGRFEELFGKARQPDAYFFTSGMKYPAYFGDKPLNYQQLCKENEYYADIAASIQRVTEEVILKLEEAVPGTSYHQEYKSARYILRRAFTSDFEF